MFHGIKDKNNIAVTNNINDITRTNMVAKVVIKWSDGLQLS